MAEIYTKLRIVVANPILSTLDGDHEPTFTIDEARHVSPINIVAVGTRVDNVTLSTPQIDRLALFDHGLDSSARKYERNLFWKDVWVNLSQKCDLLFRPSGPRSYMASAAD